MKPIMCVIMHCFDVCFFK
jgi:hypothetical protein